MAGGPSTVALVTGASRAGALGSIGAACLTPSAIEDFAARVRARIDKPFAINLFMPHAQPAISSRELEKAIGASANHRNELGLPEPKLVPPYEDDFPAQLEAVLRVKPAALSTVFGLVDTEYLIAEKRAGIFVIGTATSLEQARARKRSPAPTPSSCRALKRVATAGSLIQMPKIPTSRCSGCFEPVLASQKIRSSPRAGP